MAANTSRSTSIVHLQDQIAMLMLLIGQSTTDGSYYRELRTRSLCLGGMTGKLDMTVRCCILKGCIGGQEPSRLAPPSTAALALDVSSPGHPREYHHCVAGYQHFKYRCIRRGYVVLFMNTSRRNSISHFALRSSSISARPENIWFGEPDHTLRQLEGEH